MGEETQRQEYITEKEARTVKELFRRNLKSYKEKDASVSDQEWMEGMFQRELDGLITPEEARKDAGEILEGIRVYDENLRSVNEAAKKGISKESWLAEKIQESTTGMAVSEYGRKLQAVDTMLYQKNEELAEALRRSSDGNVKMSRNLDGNIAEHMIAKTTEMSGLLQGKNVKVEVREAYTANSVDVRATDLSTGKYQNYQLKFGKDAKTTIAMIERGNYNNQRIVVPSEQLEEVRAYFAAKGSDKTITDHIEAFGAVGKSFTKEEMKAMQIAAQESNLPPEIDYSHFRTKDLALSIGKNAAVLGIQSAAITTGLHLAAKVFRGEPMEPDELVETAVKTGADTSVKVVATGTLKVAVDRGIIRCIPKVTPAGIIANIACVGIENAKILAKVASGEISLTKGIDHMGRTTVSMVGGFAGMAQGAVTGMVAGTVLAAAVPVIGPALGVVTGLVGGMAGYFGGSKLGDMVYSAGKAVAKAAVGVAKAAWEGIKSVGSAIVSGVSGLFHSIFG